MEFKYSLYQLTAINYIKFIVFMQDQDKMANVYNACVR